MRPTSQSYPPRVVQPAQQNRTARSPIYKRDQNEYDELSVSPIKIAGHPQQNSYQFRNNKSNISANDLNEHRNEIRTPKELQP